MTARGLLAVFLLALDFVVAGIAVLLWVGLIQTRRDLLAAIPLAYVCGLAATTVLVSGFVVVGVKPVVATAVVLFGALSALALFARRRRGSASNASLQRRISALTVTLVALAGLLLASYAAAAYSHGLNSYDSWAFWTQKALVLFHFDGLDEQNFTTLPGETYPLLIPILQSLLFELAGATEAQPIELTYVLFLGAFIGSIPLLLRSLARPELTSAFLLLILVLPQVRYLALQPIGDLPLQYFFVLAVLCVLRWLKDGDRRYLVVYALLAAAAMSTKREGLLLVLALVLAALIAAGIERPFRSRLPLLAASAAAFVTTLPWRVWFSSHAGAGGEGTGAGPSALIDQLDRVWPAMSIVARLSFDYGLWSVAPIVALGAIVLGLVGPERRLAIPVIIVSGLVAASFVWILWSIPEVGLGKDDGTNPMPRAVGAIVLMWCATAPVFLQGAFGALPVFDRIRRLPWQLAAAPALAYILFVGVRGDLALASQTCSAPAVEGAPIDAVFGHIKGYAAAAALRAEAEQVGYKGMRLAPDGCGQFRVFVPEVPSLQGGESLREEARRAGFDVLLERGS